MKHWFLLLSAPLLAQELYLMPETFNVSPGQRIKVAIHSGDAFPDSEGAPPLATLKDASMYTAVGAYNMVNLRLDEKAAAVDVSIKGPGTPVLAIRTLAGVVTRDAATFHESLRRRGLAEVIEWREKNNEGGKPGKERYSRFAKAILFNGKADDAYKRRVGHPLEIMPEQNPYALAPGAALPLRVLLRGRPAAGLQVEIAGVPTGKPPTKTTVRTDQSGRLQAPVGPGKWRLNTVSLERCVDPTAADWESFAASLTFELP